MAEQDQQDVETIGVSQNATNEVRPSLVDRTLAHRYLLEREVGKGGFGVVFEARDTRLNKRVAVKCLTPRAGDGDSAFSRFKQEAIAAARIGHDGIVNVTDFDEDEDGTLFMVMEFVDGVDLNHVIASGAPLPLQNVLTIGARIAQALSAAHAKAIIHRDLKPGNVILTSTGSITDHVKIVDFGIAKIQHTEPAHTLTHAGDVIGTPRYMAPEQSVGNGVVDCRADVYALGVILYEMATGCPPYTGSTAYEVIHNKLSYDPLPPSQLQPELAETPEFDRLVLKALARKPHARHRSMAELEAAIRKVLAAVAPAAELALRSSQQLTPQSTDVPFVRSELGGGAQGTASRSRRSVTPVTGSLVTRALSPRPGAPPIRPVRPVAEPRAWRTKVVAALLVAASAGAVAMMVRGERADDPPPVREPIVPPAAGIPDASTQLPSPPIPAPLQIQLTIEPANATIELDGVVVRENPLELGAGRAYRIAVAAPGYTTEQREIAPVANGELIIKLKKTKATRPGKPQGAKTRFLDSPL